MKLPTIVHPTFSLTLPIAKKKIKYRPFLVKEEKILLIAKAGGDPNDIIDAIKQVLSNCVIDDIDMDNIAITDLEYLWIKIRAKSADNTIDLVIKEDSGLPHKFTIDLEDIEPKFNEGHTNTIKITDQIGLKMRYPTIDMFKDVQTDKDMSPDQFMELTRKCIEYVYDGDDLYKLVDFDEQEVTEFMDQWSDTAYIQIKEFFETMPRISHTLEYVDTDGKEQKINLAGLVNFFQ